MKAYNVNVPPDQAEEVAQRLAFDLGRALKCVDSSPEPGLIIIMSNVVFYPARRYDGAAHWVWRDLDKGPVGGSCSMRTVNFFVPEELAPDIASRIAEELGYELDEGEPLHDHLVAVCHEDCVVFHPACTEPGGTVYWNGMYFQEDV